MPKLRIGHRLMMIVAFAVVGLVVTISLDLISLRQTMMEDRRMLVKDMVAAAHAIATDYHGRAQAGELSPSEAQDAAKAAIGAMRYGDGDYLWVHNLEGEMLMHPTNAGLVGKNILNLADANGKRFFAEFNRLVKANGFGFVDYVWPKAGSDTPEPKVSYVQEFGPWDWVIGTGIYVDDVSAAFWSAAKKSAALALVVLLVVLAAALSIGRGISRPLGAITERIRALADGNSSIDVPYTSRGDEIGDIAKAMESFKENLLRTQELERAAEENEKRAEEQRRQDMLNLAETFEERVGGIVDSVSSAATELQATSQQLASAVEETGAQSSTIAAASEQASTNVQTVASAAEELTQAIREVSQQVSDAARLSNQVAEGGRSASQELDQLSNAVHQVTEVVAQIADVAEQTNLLALNATIEAARAGDAGKGFAVVAQEVKNLAGQTQKMTDQIGAQIDAVRTSTTKAVEVMRKVIDQVSQIDEANAAVAASVEQQSSATGEISRNATEAATGTQEVASNITGVQSANQQSGEASSNVKDASSELAKNAETLKREVTAFLGEVRAA